MKLFSTEQVSKYHPDKYADQISDAILDACLAEDGTTDAERTTARCVGENWRCGNEQNNR